MAAGAPVIAYGKGGALDTVINGETGILFDEQTHESLAHAVMALENGDYQFDPKELHGHAMKFEKPVFMSQFKAVIKNALHSE